MNITKFDLILDQLRILPQYGCGLCFIMIIIIIMNTDKICISLKKTNVKSQVAAQACPQILRNHAMNKCQLKAAT